MREDNPANPPGSWTYPWLSPNHLADLANEVLLCGWFSLSILCSVLSIGKNQRTSLPIGLRAFFALQLLACASFLLLWNPWLGFPTDWDLFSFFAWPLLAFALVLLSKVTEKKSRGRILGIAFYPALSIVLAWVVHYHHPHWVDWKEVRAMCTGTLPDYNLEEALRAKSEGEWKEAFERTEQVLEAAPHRRAEAFAVFDAPTLQTLSAGWGDPESITPLAVDFEIMAASPMTRFLVMDCWGRLFFQEGGYYSDWSIHGLPNIPEHRAVDFEIVPWRKAAVILQDNGDLFEVPVSSWPNPNPSKPRGTLFQDSSPDREPKAIGNFYKDFCGTELPRGQRAVALTLDYWNERMIVLDTAGGLVGDGTGTDFEVTKKAALVRCDAEANYNGEFVFVVNHFGKVTSWPGYHSSVQVIHDIGWPAITDLELTRGGNDLYLLDGQGGVAPFSRLENAMIDPSRMNHYHPTDEPLDSSPYISEPLRYFIDLEMVPNEKAYYKLTANFRIHYSEQP